ncbi:MAG: hypothetical protein IT481_01765 [Gammaproteobacteria bacterium]|nr:hypothetical protein [Gammaproteobacteria bacterium]
MTAAILPFGIGLAALFSPPAGLTAAASAALAAFGCVIIVAGGSLLAVVIRGFDVSKEKQARLTARLELLKTGRAQAPPGG